MSVLEAIAFSGMRGPCVIVSPSAFYLCGEGVVCWATLILLLRSWGPCNASRCRIDSQHLHHVGDGFQLQQCATSEFVVAAEEVGVKDIFPRAAAHGTRLDLAQADIAIGKNAQGFMKRARNIFQTKRN